MSEYPWDIENMMLAQHDQPCDCAICDQIHFNRATRRRERNDFDPVKERDAAYDLGFRDAQRICDKEHSCAQVDCPYCEIDRLRAELQAAKAKCNIYKCMDRKDLKLHIEQLKKQIGELAERGEADTLHWKGVASDFRAALDRIASGYWNEAQCHNIARAALEI